MATVVLRPNATSSSTEFCTLVGAASFHAALSDNSDSSYAAFAADPASDLHLGLTTFAMPAYAQARSIRARFRGALAAAGASRRMLIGFGPPPFNMNSALVNSTSLGSYQGDQLSSLDVSEGTPLTQAEIDSLVFHIQTQDEGAFPIVRIYEAYVDFVYNEAPVATPSAPTGTITTTAQPTVTWAYADPEGDLAERYRIKVFTAAQYGAGGFDPETSTATWDSGTVLSSAGTAPVGAPLLSGTYRAYVKTADAGSNGRFGPWAYSAFVLVIDVPPAPTVSATPDPTLARVAVAVQGDGTGPFTGRRALIERSLDAGATWADLRGDDVALDGSHAATVYDYEAPRAVSIQYRARITGIHDINGATMTGPYSTAATMAGLASVGWWLKDPLAPTRNTRIQVDAFPFRTKEPQAVYEPLGREDSVVVSDGVKGIEGSMSVWLKSKADYDAVQLLVSAGRALWLEDALGRAWYIKVGATHDYDLIRALPAAGETTPIRHLHRVTLPFVEVSRPSSA